MNLFISKNACECSKIRNRPFVSSMRKAGAYVYFGHISSFFSNILDYANSKYPSVMGIRSICII